MSNTKRGDAVILEEESHIYRKEVGGLASVGGLLTMPLKGHFGILDPNDICGVIRPQNIKSPEPKMVCIENTHNQAGGIIMNPNQIEAISKVTREHCLKFYMDAARIFNASVALEIDEKKFARNVDNLTFSLAKGLCCPLGSIIVGTHEFIDKARRVRQTLGGGIHKAGIFAACGIIALEEMVDRLQEDNNNAKLLAKGLDKLDGISINMKTIQTNMVKFGVSGLGVTSEQFISKLKEERILALAMDKYHVRLVTHRTIEKKHIENVLIKIDSIVKNLMSKSITSSRFYDLL
jgi:threonine aldolase